MKEPKDKRTKAWKEWNTETKKVKKGLGDLVEDGIKAIGADKLVDKDDCGCDKRKSILNKIVISSSEYCVIFPKKFDTSKDFIEFVNKNSKTKWTNTKCFTEEQYNYWTEFRKEKGDLSQEQIKKLREIMIQLFSVDIGKPSCCVDQYINEVNKVYETY
jgi:hypothetical protein